MTSLTIVAVLCLQMFLSKERPLLVQDKVPYGVSLFLRGGFGGLNLQTLETSALPFKLIQAAHILAYSKAEGLNPDKSLWPRVVAQYGVLTPTNILYGDGKSIEWNHDALGFVRGDIKAAVPPVRVEAVNLGCALCHAGVVYDHNGMPVTSTAQIGTPNTSFNPEAYINGTYGAMKSALRDPAKLLAAVQKFNPDLTLWEWLSLRFGIIPMTASRIEELSQGLDRAFNYPNGGPGLTNGIGALKYQLGFMDPTKLVTEAGYTSIPSIADRDQRTSLLYDGLYKTKSGHTAKDLAGIIGFFVVPTMGVKPENIPDHQEDVVKVFNDAVATYRPLAFPGKVDSEKAKIGHDVYNNSCKSCHGGYEGEALPGKLHLRNYPNHFAKISDINTDPERAFAADSKLIKTISQMAYKDYMTVESHRDVYASTILTGLWLSAPYLHNGSVPTLWHLLHPEQRPTKFMVGGHSLDFSKVGINGEMKNDVYQYPPSYVPWSRPEIYDTSTRGRDRRGHEKEFTSLTELDKDNLLEFLKCL